MERLTPKWATGLCGTCSPRESRRTLRYWPSTRARFCWRSTPRRASLKGWCCTRLSAEARATDRRNSSDIEERRCPPRNRLACCCSRQACSELQDWCGANFDAANSSLVVHVFASQVSSCSFDRRHQRKSDGG